MKLEEIWFEYPRMKQGDLCRVYVEENGRCELVLKRCEVIRDKNHKVISLSLDFEETNNMILKKGE